MSHKVIVLGTGPAGLTAALYAARADLEPLVLEGPEPGGQLAMTTEVENFPGFREGIMGPDLIEACRAQAARFGAEFKQVVVESVDFSERPFKINTADGVESAETVIVSTGATARRLGLPSEQKFWGYGVSACATCDGFFFRDKKVLVIGGGDSAMEEAMFLTKFASGVTVVHRRDELRASKIMAKRALDHPKVDFIWDSVIDEVLGEEGDVRRVTGAKIKNVKTGEVTEIETDGIFMAIGHTPNVAFLGGQIETDDSGFIKVKEPSTRTNIEGVFACGDVTDPHYKQAITAAGQGCKAALDAERFLSALE